MRSAGEPRNPQLTEEFATAVGSVRSGVRVIVGYDGDDPQVVWPVQLRRRRMAEPVGFPLADFQGPLARGDLPFDPGGALAAAHLDTYDFDHLLYSPSALFERWTRKSRPSPYIDLAGGLDAYHDLLAARGSDVIARCAYLRRRIERDIGAVQVDLDCQDPDVLDGLVAWKRSQYRATAAQDSLAAPWRRDLLHYLHQNHTDDCTGSLSVLRADGQPIAMHFGLRSQRVFHYWFPVYDPAYGKYSPGLVLLMAIVQASAAHGFLQIDLGAGQQEYKRRLATAERTLLGGSIERPSVSVLGRRIEEHMGHLRARAHVGSTLRAVRRSIEAPKKGGGPAEQ